MNFSQAATKLPAVAIGFLENLEQRLQNSEVKQDEDLLNLYSVFGSVLQRALDILEKCTNLTIYTTKDKRELIEIKGDQGRCYRVFPGINFCPCLAFKHQVIERKEQVTCKHVLAARLAQILGQTAKHEVTKEQYLMLLKSMFNLDGKQ